MTTGKLRKAIEKQGDLPAHIAIIMDGNGRWAKSRSLTRLAGHREGINSVREVTRVCGEIGIKHLTLFTFSTENWNRPSIEVSALMRLLLSSIRAEIKNLHENKVRLTTIGAIEDLPKDARKGIMEGIELMKNNDGLNLNLALSYGGRQELMKAIRQLAGEVRRGEITPDDISEEMLASHLYTAHMPDPDLLIRTGGEYRLSNFLLWQMAYTEIYITSLYWPDFREKELLKAVYDYQTRERRFGKLSEQVAVRQ